MSHQLALAAVLKGLRNACEVPQDKTLGVDPSYIQQIERAKGNPSLQVLEELAQAFSIDISLLVTLISAYSRGTDPEALLESIGQELGRLRSEGALTLIAEAMSTPTAIGRPRLDKRTDVAKTAREHLDEGLSYSEIATKMGISKTSVARYLKKEI